MTAITQENACMRGPTVLIATAVVLALNACEAGHFEDGGFHARFELPAGTRLVRVDVREGAVTFKPGEPGVVTVDSITRKGAPDEAGLARLRDIDMRLQAGAAGEPGVLVLEGPRMPAELAAADPRFRLITRCLVQVPPEVAIDGRSGMGPMSAEDWRADVRLETANGQLRIGDCVGEAVLRSGRGTVIVDRHSGSLDIELAGFHGERVEGQDPEGESMQVFVGQLGPKGIRIVAPHANVQCHVPKDAAFVLDVVSGCGRGRNGFGIPVEPVPGKQRGVRMQGVVGGGDTPVRIAVEVGNVSVSARKSES